MKKILGPMMALFLSAAGAFGAPEDVRFYGGSYDGWDRQAMAQALGLGGAMVTFSSGTDQVFNWSEVSASLAMLTLEAESPQSTITNGGTIRISVPALWRCRFDTSATPSIAGDAAGKVGSTSFSGDQRTLLIPVTANFADADTLTISGLKLADLRLVPAGTASLELDFTGDGVRDVYDIYPIQLRVTWSGGSYDGWDRQTLADYANLTVQQGTIFKIY